VPEPQPAEPGGVRAVSERGAPVFPEARAVPGPPVPASEPESALGSLEAAGGSPARLELAAAVAVTVEEGEG
jgi:hypothetical protein